MNRSLLTTGLMCGLLGTVLAVPTASRAAAPDVAPPPRVKYTAPKLASAYEVLVYTNQRPLRVTVTVQYEGKSLDNLWRDRLQKAFAFCDRDDDGFLSEKETKFVFSDQGMQQLLVNGFYQPTPNSAPTLAKLDRDGDGKVSFEEFVAYYSLTAEQMVRALPPQPDNAYNANVTEALFKLLDGNNDGKLTKDEVAAVEKLIATRDSDEDECLNMQELAPNLFDPRFGQPVRPVQPPNGQPYVAPAVNQMVVVYETGRVPGTVTQRVIQKYDKDNDFELTQAEIGFDDAQFKALDRDGNGRLDGEELDAWRTGEPDAALILSLAPKATDCVAKLTDEKAAAARGIIVKQADNNRLVLHVGRQALDFTAFSPNVQVYGVQSLKLQYGYLFTQAAGGKNHVTAKDLEGPNAVNFQFVKVIFEAADRDGDGKMTKDEFDTYFDLQDSFRNISLSLTPAVQTPTLFNLLDENRDGRLSVRELRTAWKRLVVLEEPGAEVITKNIIQPTVNVRLSRTYERFYAQQPAQQYYNPNQPAPVPTKGPLWFRKMDRNGDGDLSRTEYIGTKAEFDAIDSDSDGLISLDEAEAWDKKMREKENDAPKQEKP